MANVERQERDNQRKQATRHNLLRAASRVFIRNGYHKTLVSDIAKEANVGQGTFYRHFRDKREIFGALFDQFTAQMLAEFMPMSAVLPADTREYEEMSLSAMRRAVAAAEENLDLLHVFLEEGPSIDRGFETELEDVLERFADIAQFYLDYAISRGFARPCNSRVAAEAVVGVALRLLKSNAAGRLSDLQREQLIVDGVDFAFRGFGRYPAVTEMKTGG